MSTRAGAGLPFFLASFVLAGVASCTSAAPEPVHPSARAADPKPSATPTDARAGGPAPDTGEGGKTEASERRPLIVLPSDADFLRAPLPPAAPNRYSSWREVERIDVGQSHLTQVDRLPSGKLVTLSQAEGKVRVYERGQKRLVARHDNPTFQEFEPSALLAWPTAPDRFVQGTPRGLELFDAPTGTLLGSIDPHPVWKLRWSADARLLMALGPGEVEGGSTLRFFARGDGAKMQPLGELSFQQRVDAWDLSPDARLLALAHYPSEEVRVLDLQAGGEELFRGPAPRYAGDVAFSPDGRFLAVVGDGLLLLDLANTDRRAFYSYLKNNAGHVRFSPSGDAVIMSSYDGKLRILGIGQDASGRLELTLLKELSHAGDANVYAFVLSSDGSELISASGDRTLRTFAGPSKAPSKDGTQGVFHDLDTWRKLDPEATAPPKAREEQDAAGEIILQSERGPARPSRIAPGRYACKITTIYKLRDCTVRRDAAGRTRLEFAPDNLLHLGGVLWDDGPAVRFEGKLLSPSTVIECKGCEHHTLKAVFRGQSGHYQGLLTFRTYFDPLVPLPVPPLDVRIEEASDRFPVVLQYQGPLDGSDESRKE